MKKHLLSFGISLFFGASALFAQVTHDVTVANFSFTPSVLTIQQGDVVRWFNNGGNHNVNGSVETFPGNIQGFKNEASTDQWVFEVTFPEVGTNNYRCDIHPQMMTGQIIVEMVMSTPELQEANIFSFYPNPVVGELRWTLNDSQDARKMSMTIHNVEGRIVENILLTGTNSHDLSALANGVYTYMIKEGNQAMQSGKLIIEHN